MAMSVRGDTSRTDCLKITLDTKNALPSSPVSLQLPVELLRKIFLLLVNVFAREHRHPSRLPEWIAVTYVCRYWRSAALGLPELWTCITPALSISWSQAMMDRSTPLPVHIDRHIGVSSADGVEALATSGLLSASRIQTLHLLGHAADIVKVISHLCSPSPLETLSLFVAGTTEPVDIPETFCARDTPHFRRLTLETAACIRAPLWLLASVTHFKTSASVSLHELVSTLQAMPQLEVLSVQYIHYEWKYNDAPLLTRAVLPRLSLLSVRENSPDRLVILSSRIDTPPTLRRHLFWRVYHINEWEPKLFTALRALVPQDSAPGMDDGCLRAAQVSGGPARGSFEAWSRTGADTASLAREDALFLFHLDWQRILVLNLNPGASQYDEDCPFFYLTSLCAQLHTRRIEDLTIAPEPPSASESWIPDDDELDVGPQWRTLLAALPAVKTLRLHRGGPGCVSVLRALGTSPDLLPRLQKVFVVQSIVRCAAYAAGSAAPGGCVGFADTDAGFAIANHEFVQENVGAELVEAVSVRSGLEVVLVGCKVDEETLKALRERARVDFGNEWEYM